MLSPAGVLEGAMTLKPQVLMSVLTICRDNSEALSETLDSIASQRFQSGELGLEVIVVDGSESLGCFHETERHRPQLAQQGWQMRWMERPARGIYDALNAALTLARGRWLQVLPAGDLYADDRSLERLLAHGRRRLDAGRPPAAVFGQAWVEVPGRPLRWLTPDSRVRSMTAWLGRMVPCHQAFCSMATGPGPIPTPPTVRSMAIGR